MSHAVDYRIVEVQGERGPMKNPFGMLEQEVKEAIKEGWQPAGGLSVAVVLSSGKGTPVFHLAQAMTRSLKPL